MMLSRMMGSGRRAAPRRRRRVGYGIPIHMPLSHPHGGMYDHTMRTMGRGARRGKGANIFRDIWSGIKYAANRVAPPLLDAGVRRLLKGRGMVRRRAPVRRRHTYRVVARGQGMRRRLPARRRLARRGGWLGPLMAGIAGPMLAGPLLKAIGLGNKKRRVQRGGLLYPGRHGGSLIPLRPA